jgi:alpha-galactosidase
MNNVDFFAHSDADMLEVGNGKLNREQERSHFALWVAMKSPLLVGADLSKISQSSLSILKTQSLLAFHQDSTIGRPAQPFKWNWTYDIKKPPQYWAGQFTGGTMLWLFNSNSRNTTMGVSLSEIPGLVAAEAYKIADGWTGADLGCLSSTDVLKADNIKAFDTALFVLKAQSLCLAGNSANKVVLQNPILPGWTDAGR